MNERTSCMVVSLRPVWLAGLAGALAVAVIIGLGRLLEAEYGWFAWLPGIAIIAALAGGAVYCQQRKLASIRHSESSAIHSRIDAWHEAGTLVGETAACPLERIDQAVGQTLFLRQIAEGVHGLEALFDANRRLLWVSPSVERLTGWTTAACMEASDAIEMLAHESDRRYCVRMAMQVLADGVQQDFEMRLAHRDGRYGWVACRWRVMLDGEGRRVGLRMSAEDIQARKETEYKLLETVAELRRAQALREHYLSRSNDERQRLAALLNVIGLGIIFIDHDHRVLYFNRTMLKIWGFQPEENLIGTRDVVLQRTVAPLLADPEAYFAHIEAVVGERQAVSEQFEVRMKDGRIVTDLSAVIESGKGARGIGRVWIYEDVTEQRRIANQLVALAERDPLTNLYNRRRFHEELDRLLAEAQRRGLEVGLVAIDLDGFKPINDRYGHQAGDEVLVGIAEGVGRIIRRNEMLFRLGGDEFAMLVPDTTEAELSELAARLVEGVDGLSFSFGGQSVGVTASIGIALFPRHGADGEALMAAADQAMYQSKSHGRNRWMVSGDGGSESDRMSATNRNLDEPPFAKD
ncbi:diguanylate cyclase domain-containing protein [Azoarcus sp. DD4]|uniref:sensor domain-containing diguanylate cyclase n=1 Tax=Azoarcus sp. DD4 TaxID=2027405 RepID=UPI001F0E4824|nr:diguanylate cyclase [Azoarcus sp. DD4]